MKHRRRTLIAAAVWGVLTAVVLINHAITGARIYGWEPPVWVLAAFVVGAALGSLRRR